jgi:pyruvate dehydrogenase E2 component (dihydrolipoamide acetyltransferase)
MGAAVAARLTAARQLRVRALTLIAPAGLGPEIDADFIHGVAAATTDGALAHLLRRLARRPPQLSRAQLGGMAREFAKGRLKDLAADLAAHGRQGVDIVPDLAAIANPLQIVWGLEDRINPWTQVAAAPSRAAIHLISDAGHMPQWDKPQELAELL